MFRLWSVQNTLMWSLSTLFKLFRAFKNYSRTVIGKIFMLFPQMKLNIQAKLFCKWTWRVLRQWFSRSQPLDFLIYNTNRSMIEVCSKYCSLSNKNNIFNSIFTSNYLSGFKMINRLAYKFQERLTACLRHFINRKECFKMFTRSFVNFK